MDPRNIKAIFETDFGTMEYALKRSGYLKTGRDYAAADWGAFAKDLGESFFDHVVATGVAKTLIGHPPRKLLNTLKWSPEHPLPLRTVQDLIVIGVGRVRNNCVHSEKFVGGPEGQWDRDLTLVREAHAVLKAAIEAATQAKIIAA